MHVHMFLGVNNTRGGSLPHLPQMKLPSLCPSCLKVKDECVLIVLLL